MIIRVIDFETTGLAPPDAKIVEWATFDLIDGAERGRAAGSLCDPGISIPPETSAVHHIVDEDVNGKPSFEEQLPDVTKGDPQFWCAHNKRFEQQWFNPAGSKWIDTYKLAVWLWPDCPSHSNQCLRYWLKLRLADPAGAVPHRAFGDAYVTTAILRRMLSVCKVTMEDAIEVSSQPVLLPRLRFGEHAMKPIAEVPTSYFEWIAFKSKGPWDEDVLHTAKQQIAARRT